MLNVLLHGGVGDRSEEIVAVHVARLPDLGGPTAAADIADAQRAIAAARTAFDTTDWSTNVELRVRCLDQLHAALVDFGFGRVSALAELPKALAHELRKRKLPARIRFGDDPVFRIVQWDDNL